MGTRHDTATRHIGQEMVFACTAFPGSTSLLPLLARAPPSAAISGNTLLAAKAVAGVRSSIIFKSCMRSCGGGARIRNRTLYSKRKTFHRNTGKTRRSMIRLPPSRPRLMRLCPRPCSPAVVWDGHETDSATSVPSTLMSCASGKPNFLPHSPQTASPQNGACCWLRMEWKCYGYKTRHCHPAYWTRNNLCMHCLSWIDVVASACCSSSSKRRAHFA